MMERELSEKLGEFSDLKRKAFEILYLDLGGSILEGCSEDADPDRRLLPSNADIGVPILARDFQPGLDFQQRPSELFDGQAMGEDAFGY